ncbi:MAG: hypothetical protein HOM96_04735, partial [Rickettsiales bacterium]|nr:hypothetical protein [Rickettsiales bacterium]
MQIALFILLIISSGAAGIFALSLRKYQNKIFEQTVTNKKKLDESDVIVALKDQELDNSKTEIEHLTAQITEHNNNLQTEITNAFNKGFKASESSTTEIKTKLADKSAQLKILRAKIQHLSEHAEVSKESDKVRSKMTHFLDELNETTGHCLQGNLLRQQDIAHNNNITLIPNKIDKSYYLTFDYILANSQLVENEDYLIDKLTTENNVEKCHYTVFIISSETVILVDNKLAVFFEENTNALTSSDPKIITQINDIIEERINFLSNTELQNNIKDIVTNLDSVQEVKNLIAAIYVPSEIIFNDLLKSDFDFFRKINKAKIKPLVPASIVSIIKSAESSFLLEDALVNYKIVEDIVHDMEKIISSMPSPPSKKKMTKSKKLAAKKKAALKSSSKDQDDIMTNVTQAPVMATDTNVSDDTSDLDLDFSDDSGDEQETLDIATDSDLDFADDSVAEVKAPNEPETPAIATDADASDDALDLDLDFADDSVAEVKAPNEPETPAIATDADASDDA